MCQRIEHKSETSMILTTDACYFKRNLCFDSMLSCIYYKHIECLVKTSHSSQVLRKEISV